MARCSQNMSKRVVAAGKGGTGKTTLASMLVRYLVETGKGSVLAVDADFNSTLNKGPGLGGGGHHC